MASEDSVQTARETREQAARRLIRLRKALGCATPRELVAELYPADEVEAAFRRLQKYEKAKALPPPEFIGRLKAYCGADWNYIYGGDMESLPVRLYRKLQQTPEQEMEADAG
mgnify:CR=1 FL=1